MKARDLAALAALGLGGAYLYNRGKGQNYGNEGRNAPLPGQNAGNEGRNAALPGEDYSNEGRNAPMSNQDYGNEGRNASVPMGTRGAYMGGDSVVAKPATKAVAPVAKTPVAAPAVVDARAGARGAQGYGDDDSSSMAAKAALAQGDAAKVNSLGTTKAYMDDQRAKAAAKSTAAKATLAQGDAAKVNSLGATKAYMDSQRAKKAAATANSQAIIDRMANRKRPYLKDEAGRDMKRGGAVKKMASGGSVSSASSRGDGIAQRGKTRGRMC
jgi:hypothetical protein